MGNYNDFNLDIKVGQKNNAELEGRSLLHTGASKCACATGACNLQSAQCHTRQTACCHTNPNYNC